MHSLLRIPAVYIFARKPNLFESHPVSAYTRPVLGGCQNKRSSPDPLSLREGPASETSLASAESSSRYTENVEVGAFVRALAFLELRMRKPGQ